MTQTKSNSSMEYWFPIVSDLDIPMPKTEFAIRRQDPCDWFGLLDGEPVSTSEKKALKTCAKELGYPLFMRTDLCSGKHDYLHTCFIESEKELISHLWRLVEDNACKDLYFNSIVVREFIELDWRFKAFHGLPIAPERRYFIRDGEVVCRHPYWPEDCIHFSKDSPEVDGWKSMLAEMNTESDEEVEILTSQAMKIASVLPGAWSVDFAKGKDGTWYMIDMALANASYHLDDCEHMCSFGGLI